MEIVAQVISGGFGEILVRQKHGKTVELGDLLIVDTSDGHIILQAYDLIYGSQLPAQVRELISGLKLEGQAKSLSLTEPDLDNYIIIKLKSLVNITKDSVPFIPKTLPKFFSDIRAITKEDLNFITITENPIYIGKVRSGSKVLDVDINLTGVSVLSHHILVPATTGRGKSNLVKVVTWGLVDKDFCGMLILDPHDEYYGRKNKGLKDHPKSKDNVVYYTPSNVPPGAFTLKININKLRPWHFRGTIDLSPAQKEACYAYSNIFGEDWIQHLLQDEEPQGDVNPVTLSTLRRKFNVHLGLATDDSGNIVSSGIFDTNGGESTISDIVSNLVDAKTVIVDTSVLGGQLELLVGSMISGAVLSRYKKLKGEGNLEAAPVISIVLEEAPRVLGKDALQSGGNIFSTIAREGRKFKIGLLAITQLPSLIPREILANMNTKIVLGIEMAPERRSIIDSASQDLSTDERNIASLDIGECIVTSNFTKFAIPVRIPLFEDFIEPQIKSKKNIKEDYSGAGI